jgi:hypothetical protein
MKCPYCLSDIDENALVCKVCKRDLYLLKPMMEKISVLQAQVADTPDREPYEGRIRSLEQQLEAALRKPQSLNDSVKTSLADWGKYILLPLCLLLIAHLLITVVYDSKPLYLRIISIALPLPFGYFLFSEKKRALLPWFAGTAFLAIASVIGMSSITSLVDKTPILPKNAFEWREFLEYAASISFSFLTGMLLGRGLYAHHNPQQPGSSGLLAKVVISRMDVSKISPENLQQIMSKLNDYGGTLVALASTGASIYTGMRGFLEK